MQDRENLKDTDQLEMSLKKNIKAEIIGQVFESLIHASKFSRDELAATASLQIFQADDIIGHMLRSRVIRKGEANVWEITKAGKKWMESK
jgi:predicted transcriptional regulator